MNIFKFYRLMSFADQETIATLLTDYQTHLDIDAVANENVHAEILLSLIRATTQNLGITDIKSSKSDSNQQCIVTFKEGDKYQRWKFKEASNVVSENFLNHALKYVAKRAHGRFVLMRRKVSLLHYLFVPSSLYKALNNALDNAKKSA